MTAAAAASPVAWLLELTEKVGLRWDASLPGTPASYGEAMGRWLLAASCLPRFGLARPADAVWAGAAAEAGALSAHVDVILAHRLWLQPLAELANEAVSMRTTSPGRAISRVAALSAQNLGAAA